MKNKLPVEAFAHGRLDVMGGIADYSGSLVLQMPIREKTTVRLTLRSDYISTFNSKTESGEVLHATVDVRTFLVNGEVDYSFAQVKFKELNENSWIAYVLGCALLLQKAKQIDFRGGDFTIESSIPLGKGVSSSASIEIATMKALAEAFAISLTGTELPILAQRVENLLVGAPCGLMDQLSCYFARPQTLLPIICQPDKVQDAIAIPEGVHFVGIDSGVRHSVGGSSYTDVRCAAFMGYTIIAELCGTTSQEIQKAIINRDFSQLPYKGYLCNISVQEYEAHYKKLLPDFISGKEFIHKYKFSIDHVTTIDETKNYAINVCTSHPIYENNRVSHFRNNLLALENPERQLNIPILKEMGKLMFQSHKSYSACGLGSERTDEIVSLAKQYPEIYGAKITGGGSGGTVCLLTSSSEGKESIYALQKSLEAKYKSKLKLFES